MLHPGHQTIRTMCPMNCHPTLCGMLVDVADGRLLGVRGDKDNPDSQGFLCVRGQASQEVIGNPQRLLRPLMRRQRRDDAWYEASWEEALDTIAARMQAAGREAVGLWSGHGSLTTNYGTRIAGQLMRRFANLYGCQLWSAAILCWGLGGFGLGLTGILETNTKEDMGQHANGIVLWGANLASQPNTARHIRAAQKRGATVVTIDVRHTEAAALADEVFLIRPGTDAALALAMQHVILREQWHDRAFIAQHTSGFDELAAHVQAYSPAWAAPITGIAAERIEALARLYATTAPAMIVLGGSSMHKGANSWQAARAIACLPALTGNVGKPGSGFGPRHGGASHGQALASITAEERRQPGNYIPSQMPRMTAALQDGLIDVLFLFGTNMLSSFADNNAVAAGLERTGLVVCHDLFMNETARRFADIVLPSTAWLEEIGCKMTNTHLYLMEQALEPPAETRPLSAILRGLAQRLQLEDFYPWENDAAVLDAILHHPATDYATVAALRAEAGKRALRITHVAHPDLHFHTPSGKIEFVSRRAAELGLPTLPMPALPEPADGHLTLCQGRTLTHFHAFYDHGQALPSLARLDPAPAVWLAPADAAERGIRDGSTVRLRSAQGSCEVRARVTADVPAGVAWMRDGWSISNTLTSGEACLPDHAVEAFHFAAGQAAYAAIVDARPL